MTTKIKHLQIVLNCIQVYITSLYRTTHCDARFNPKANLVNVLRKHEKLFYAGFELNSMTSHLCIAKYTNRCTCLGSHFLDRFTEYARQPGYSSGTDRMARSVPGRDASLGRTQALSGVSLLLIIWSCCDFG